ncbi:hypothetical protein KKF86_08475 [bacterium]|nr:hypothetical protein [bacterium]
MKTGSIILIVITFFSVRVSAQWASFELDNIDSEQFQQQVEPFLKTISLSTNRHFFCPNIINKQISIGVSYSQGINITGEKYSTDLMGGYPNLAGALIITQNLSLKGNMSIFKSGSDLVQSFTYGFGLNITNNDKNNWCFSVLFSKLHGPDDLKNKSTDAALIKEFDFGSLPTFVGFGLNTYYTKILIEDVDTVPTFIKGNANYLLFGAQLAKGKFTIIPILQVNSDVVIISIEISRVFK